ncbi:MAG: ChaN family lipoprotein [Deltaproteobacteria bacterium]|nr:ChaN family lipoprotein [Deltaproteobacteria bacterium]
MSTRSPSPRKELLCLQKRIFEKNDDFIKSQASVREKGFEKYEREYKRRVNRYQAVADIDELVNSILDADVIYVGDYHTNKQSQRTLLRLLKLIVDKAGPLGIGLELVQKRHQKVLDEYLQGGLDEETFLRKIQFRKYWYFDLWENFKPIFDFACFHKIPVFGIEWCPSIGCSLKRRDIESAKIINRCLQKNPKMKTVIFVGDHHIAPGHLPQEVVLLLRKRHLEKKSLIIYQNSEAIYWKLAHQKLEDKVEIVKIDEKSYCILNTPPIVWQQTYLNWLEQEGGEIDYADAKSNFLELIKRVAGFLEIPVSQKVEDIEIFTSGDLSFLEKLEEEETMGRKELRRIKKQILASESYFIPEKKIVYLANLSINHASEEATHYLRILTAGPEFPRKMVDAFYANTLHEALGFFGSKIINHKRKCFHEKDYQKLLHYLKAIGTPKKRRLELETASLILDHKSLERDGEPITYQKMLRRNPEVFFGVTHGLGYILGDRMYYALLEEKLTKEEIRQIFADPFKGEGDPFRAYMKILRCVRGVKIPTRV